MPGSERRCSECKIRGIWKIGDYKGDLVEVADTAKQMDEQTEPFAAVIRVPVH